MGRGWPRARCLRPAAARASPPPVGALAFPCSRRGAPSCASKCDRPPHWQPFAACVVPHILFSALLRLPLALPAPVSGGAGGEERHHCGVLRPQRAGRGYRLGLRRGRGGKARTFATRRCSSAKEAVQVHRFPRLCPDPVLTSAPFSTLPHPSRAATSTSRPSSAPTRR